MKRIPLTARLRSETGKGANRALRREGWFPAVLYGLQQEPVKLSFDDHLFHRATDSLGDTTLMVTLSVEDSEIRDQLAVIRETARHPVTDQIAHMDLMRVDVSKPIDVPVAVHGSGMPAGIAEGGRLEAGLRTVQLRCLPDDVPETLEVDISGLGLNQALHVSDLDLGERIEMLSPASDALFHVVVPRATAEEEADAAKAAEEEAEAEAAAAAEGAEAKEEGEAAPAE